jgi:hypothetical protein
LVEGDADGAVVDDTCSGGTRAVEDLFNGVATVNSGNDADGERASGVTGEPLLGGVLSLENSVAGDGGGAEFVDKGINGAMAVGEGVAGTYDSGIKGAIMGTGLGRFVGAASGGGRVDGANMGAAVGRDIDSVGSGNGIKGAMVGDADGVSLVPPQSSHCTAKTQSEVGSEGASPMDALPFPKMKGTVPF